MQKLRIHVFQHVAFEGLGAMEPWALSRGYNIGHTRLFAGERPPAPEAYDWLIVMGGPMGVHDEAAFPWLKAEKRVLESALKSGIPMLGVCLGAQLLAQVSGGEVFRNREKEIGWLPIRSRGDRGWPGRIFPDSLTTFHWHGDTFTLPPGAVHLASSEGCDHQAFALGEKVVGLQFHPEATPEGIATLVAHCAADLTPGRYVQAAENLAGDPDRFAANHRFLSDLMEGLESRAFS